MRFYSAVRINISELGLSPKERPRCPGWAAKEEGTCREVIKASQLSMTPETLQLPAEWAEWQYLWGRGEETCPTDFKAFKTELQRKPGKLDRGPGLRTRLHTEAGPGGGELLRGGEDQGGEMQTHF